MFTDTHTDCYTPDPITGNPTLIGASGCIYRGKWQVLSGDVPVIIVGRFLVPRLGEFLDRIRCSEVCPTIRPQLSARDADIVYFVRSQS